MLEIVWKDSQLCHSCHVHVGRRQQQLLIQHEGQGYCWSPLINRPWWFGAMPFTRPSDEDILKYEQSIMQEQVNCAPLVSPALPLQQIVKEYSTGDNERYVLKLAVFCNLLFLH